MLPASPPSACDGRVRELTRQFSQAWCDDLLPELVAFAVQVELIPDEQLRARPPVLAQHGREDVDKAEPGIVTRKFLHQPVGGPYFLGQGPTADARFDRDELDAR